MPEAYSKNKNIYRVLKDKIMVMQQIISYVDHFYFDDVDMDINERIEVKESDQITDEKTNTC